jgi:hypothetical protein
MQWSDRIGRRVKLRDLHILLAVAQTGNMVPAADSLAISQPVISKRYPTSNTRSASVCPIALRRAWSRRPFGRAFISCGTAVFNELRRGVHHD